MRSLLSSPRSEPMLGPMKLTALIKLDEQDKALEYAQKLGKSDLSKQPNGLNGLAWAIVDPDAGIKPSAKLIEFAVETARTPTKWPIAKRRAIADTLAKAYFDSGDVAKAIETQERAVRLVKGSQYEAQLDSFKDRLEEYKKKASDPFGALAGFVSTLKSDQRKPRGSIGAMDRPAHPTLDQISTSSLAQAA